MPPRVPTFALLTTRMDGWYQGQVWHGAASAADLLGVRLVALVGSAFGDPNLWGGPTEIYDLAAAPEIDGYFVLGAALANYTSAASIEGLLERLPRRPTVSMGMAFPGLASIDSDGGGMDAVARHLIEVHGLRRFAFIGGPETNRDADKRWRDWLRILAERGIEQDPDLVVRGEFVPRSGKAAAERILERGPAPEAFVCANDAMALGVHQALTARGLRIPQDIILTGYDDIEEGRTLAPPLTTVRTGAFQIAFRGMEMLLEILRGESPHPEIHPTQFLPRRSCGCGSGDPSNRSPDRTMDTQRLPSPLGLLESIGADGPTLLDHLETILEKADHAELDVWEDLLVAQARSGSAACTPDVLISAQALVSKARHGLDSRRRQSLQLLMLSQSQAIQSLTREIRGERIGQEVLEALRSFSDRRLRMLLFHEDVSPLRSDEAWAPPFRVLVDTGTGTVSSSRSGTIFPEEESAAGSWAALPLSLSGEHFGVVLVRDWTDNELFLENLRLSLTLLLSGIQKSRREAETREELLRLSRRDPLTGLLNRRGLLEQGELLARTAQRACCRIGVVLCDLDGLKEINDRHGHADGDLAIRCLSRALEDCFRQSDVLARLGGDEFAALLMLGPDASLDGAIERLREALDRRSGELGRPWTAKTSAGWTSWDPGDGQNLDAVLAQADARLYSDKRKRKAPEGEPQPEG